MEELFCPICGAKINEKNYNINKFAFEDYNVNDMIKFCPICGVTREYLKEEYYIYTTKEEELDENTLKILDHAMKLETFNGDFYKKASFLVKDKKISKIFSDLANIENSHANVHKRLAHIKEIPKLKDMDYTKYKEDEIFLDMASKREKHAVAYYNKYIREIKIDSVKKVFKALAKVEEDHIDILDK
ncbi:ferritin family protein [Clostridium oceanicum]|uniref:Ferritin family protein n=1 Tax=Clostridium oceanicum TaxID=1543 RepID=A0ABP3UPG2_9CLOT